MNSHFLQLPGPGGLQHTTQGQENFQCTAGWAGGCPVQGPRPAHTTPLRSSHCGVVRAHTAIPPPRPLAQMMRSST